MEKTNSFDNKLELSRDQFTYLPYSLENNENYITTRLGI